MRKAARLLAGRMAGRMASPRLLARWARARDHRGLVLNYHVIRPAALDQHLDVLSDLFEIVPLDELLRRLREARAGRGGRGGDRMPVVLTFDDGKRTHLTEVAPLLARRGAHATFFVTSEPSRTGTIHWFDLAKRIERTAGIPRRELRRSLKQADSAHRDEVLANLAREHGVDTAPQDDDERPLTPAEVGSLARMGFTIGSHSATHPILTEEGEERIWREVDGSRRTISGWIGAPVRHFAYPNGNASKATEVHTRRAGYETAWTTVQLWVAARQDDHRLPRLQIFPWYDRGQIALKAGLALLSLLPSADGTGYAYRSERRDDARA